VYCILCRNYILEYPRAEVVGEQDKKEKKGEITNHDRVLFYAVLRVLLFFEQGA
jgi:hypothetical protein